jgi:hypothetical protein
MAKPKVTGSSEKLVFGKRKSGQPGGKKSFNKHSSRTGKVVNKLEKQLAEIYKKVKNLK